MTPPPRSGRNPIARLLTPSWCRQALFLCEIDAFHTKITPKSAPTFHFVHETAYFVQRRKFFLHRENSRRTFAPENKNNSLTDSNEKQD